MRPEAPAEGQKQEGEGGSSASGVGARDPAGDAAEVPAGHCDGALDLPGAPHAPLPAAQPEHRDGDQLPPGEVPGAPQAPHAGEPEEGRRDPPAPGPGQWM